jgi:hypothetical protein
MSININFDSRVNEALSKPVVSPDLQNGFKVLRDKGRLDEENFSEEVIQAAQWRLDNAKDLL